MKCSIYACIRQFASQCIFTIYCMYILYILYEILDNNELKLFFCKLLLFVIIAEIYSLKLTITCM